MDSIRSTRGSFMIAGALFMVVFLMVAGMGVDVSRYFMKKDQLQSIADGAALSGARALNRFENEPDQSVARQAVLDYIEETQGPEFRDLYQVQPDGSVDGIVIRNMDENGDGCKEGFTLDDDEIVLSQQSNVKTEILGSAITLGEGGEPLPVTTKITVSDEQGNDTEVQPWGDFNDPDAGNVNTNTPPSPFDMSDSPAGLKLSVTARSFMPSGNEHLTVANNDDLAQTVRHGDIPPEIDGFGDQGDAVDFVQEFQGDDGSVQLNDNQAIMFFELGETSGPAADFQDLVILVTMVPSNPPPGSTTTTSEGSSSSNQWEESECSFGMAPYRVGVQVYSSFSPYFFPKTVFGYQNEGLTQRAVAEIQPTILTRAESIQPNCGVFADKNMNISGNNLDASNTDFCGNADILAGFSQNGTMKNAYYHGVFTEPGGAFEQARKLNKQHPIPDFVHTDPSDYEVVVNQSNYNNWPSCGGGPNPGKQLQNQSGQNLVWSNGGNACIEHDGDSTFTISGNNNGFLQNSDGSPASLFVSESLIFGGNGLDVNGGIYSKGDIFIDGNNHDFSGDPSNLGGLALWSEGSIDISLNNIEIDGILGSEGDLSMGSMGGGNGPDLEGVVVSGGSFTFPSNSNSARIEHDTSKYNPDKLLNDNWTQDPQEQRVSAPNFAHANIRLLN